ncbi:unnamed protein product, partial [Mesorhabditis spiculigera]
MQNGGTANFAPIPAAWTPSTSMADVAAPDKPLLENVIKEREDLKEALRFLKQENRRVTTEKGQLHNHTMKVFDILSPFREILLGHGIFREYMAYEASLPDFFFERRDVKMLIQREIATLEESQERHKTQEMALELLLSEEAWRERRIVDRTWLQEQDDIRTRLEETISALEQYTADQAQRIVKLEQAPPQRPYDAQSTSKLPAMPSATHDESLKEEVPLKEDEPEPQREEEPLEEIIPEIAEPIPPQQTNAPSTSSAKVEDEPQGRSVYLDCFANYKLRPEMALFLKQAEPSDYELDRSLFAKQGNLELKFNFVCKTPIPRGNKKTALLVNVLKNNTQRRVSRESKSPSATRKMKQGAANTPETSKRKADKRYSDPPAIPEKRSKRFSGRSMPNEENGTRR